jgi:hypothetical protein
MARTLSIWIMLLALSSPVSAWAQDADCLSTSPVLSTYLTLPAEWRLPLSSHRPDVLTEARIALDLVPPSAERKLWSARIHVSFPDPKPLGLPYSFEKLILAWNDAGVPGYAILDWTDGCTQPGRSLFPGQNWIQNWELPGTEGLSGLPQPSMALWGGRN